MGETWERHGSLVYGQTPEMSRQQLLLATLAKAYLYVRRKQMSFLPDFPYFKSFFRVFLHLLILIFDINLITAIIL